MLGRLLLIVLLLPHLVFAEQLTKLTEKQVSDAEFFLFDIKDHSERVVSSIDAYQFDDQVYIALVPLFEGLKVRYKLLPNEVQLFFNDVELNVELLTESVDQQTAYWIDDGVFIYLPVELLANFLGTQYKVNLATLSVNFSGHNTEFPYKIIRANIKQRQLNQYVTQSTDDVKKSQSVITVPDTYRFATIPNGYTALKYQNNGTEDSVSGVVQGISDFAYHSTSMTFTRNNDEWTSNVRLSRYPTQPGEKILGIWDNYSFGDVFSRSASLNNNQSRGLGFTFSSNDISGRHENFTTSFIKFGRPNWEVDVFHNGQFLESRVVPEDGILEFNNMEVDFGYNTFKLVMYGPYGEVEEIIEEVDVRQNALAKGDSAYDLSILEYDSSLLDINTDEFDVDAVSGSYSYGLTDNWMITLRSGVSNIHDEDKRETLNIINQFSLPDWFIENNVKIDDISLLQSTSVATSIFNQDSLIFNYNSTEARDGVEFDETSEWSANYTKRFNHFTARLQIASSQIGELNTTTINNSVSHFGRYFTITNNLFYKESNENDLATFSGSVQVSSRVGRNYRINAILPYDVNEGKAYTDSIVMTGTYYHNTESYRHNLNLSTRPLGEELSWTLGYDLAMQHPTHQLTFGARYDSNDSWNISLGLVFGFGYDYYNNRFAMTRDTIHSGGTIDVHAYIDRRLNGYPDILDYDLEGVTFDGNLLWQATKTNKEGKARLFGSNVGVTRLRPRLDIEGKALNQDYVIYSHPGSQQYVNLPLYLTTEVEFFILLETNGGVITLSSVPIVARNLSTGDEYLVESDVDGYVNYTGLLPGEYQVEVEEAWLSERGYKSEFKGMKFVTPFEGGFIVLPDIELKNEMGSQLTVNSYKEIELNETNLSLNKFNNDKLVHLPPEGGFRAAYSLENMEIARFNRISNDITNEEKELLRQKLSSADERRRINSVGASKVTRLPLNELEKLVNIEMNEQPNNGLKQLSYKEGWVIQFAAFASLEAAEEGYEPYQSFGVYVVAKEINKKTWYGLVSKIFSTRAEALSWKKQNGVEGYIQSSKVYKYSFE